jgi:membrane protein
MDEVRDSIAPAAREGRCDAPRAPRRPAPLGARAVHALRETGDFIRRVYEKASADNIFFMAGAIAFNVLVAFVPLLLAALGIAGTLLRIQEADPTDAVMRYILESIPAVPEESVRQAVQGVLQDLIDQSTGLLGLGTLILVWLATRLVGTLRTVLREVFDLRQERGIIEGKLFDIKMVVTAGTLLALNVGLTIVLEIIAEFGLGILDLEPGEVRAVQLLYGRVLAFLAIWAMFLLIYRFLPMRRIHWRTAVVAATFTAVLFEVMKLAFGWYATNVANYRSTYGSLTALIILFLWIYYTAVVFILGGEVAQVVAMRRIRRRQRERLR